MPESSFIGYVGDPDFHDGTILTIERDANFTRVRIRGASGNVFAVDFDGVSVIRANRPEGMMLYALSEMSCEPPLRRFVFANWDDEGESFLEIDAACFSIRQE